MPGYLDWRGAIPRDGTTLAIGRDFLNFWMYGRAAATAEPGRFYDAATYNAELLAVLGPGFPGQNWSYPPSVMLLAAPFAQIDYLARARVWSLLGLRCFSRSRAARWRLAPASVSCFACGGVLPDLGAELLHYRGNAVDHIRLAGAEAGARRRFDRSSDLETAGRIFVSVHADRRGPLASLCLRHGDNAAAGRRDRHRLRLSGLDGLH